MASNSFWVVGLVAVLFPSFILAQNPLVGNWVGESSPSQTHMVFQFSGGVVTTYIGNDYSSGTYTLPTATTPKRISMDNYNDGDAIAIWEITGTTLTLLIHEGATEYPTTFDLADPSCNSECIMVTLEKQDDRIDTELLGIWAGSAASSQAVFEFLSPDTYKLYGEDTLTLTVFTRSSNNASDISFAYNRNTDFEGEVHFGSYEVSAGPFLQMYVGGNGVARPTDASTCNAGCTVITAEKQDNTPDANLAGVWIGYAETRINATDKDALYLRFNATSRKLYTQSDVVGTYYTCKNPPRGEPSWLTFFFENGDNNGQHTYSYGVYNFTDTSYNNLVIQTNTPGSVDRLIDFGTQCPECYHNVLTAQQLSQPETHELHGYWGNDDEERKASFHFECKETTVSSVTLTVVDNNGGQTGTYDFYLGMVNDKHITLVNDNGEIYLGLYQITTQQDQIVLNIGWNENGNGYRPTSFNRDDCDTCDFFTLYYKEVQSTNPNDAPVRGFSGYLVGLLALLVLSWM